jgi:hypothetical protein
MKTYQWNKGDYFMQNGILKCIALLENIKGKTDQESFDNVSLVAQIMDGKVHRQWPDNDLCKAVYALEPDDKALFLDVLKDILEGMIEQGVV